MLVAVVVRRTATHGRRGQVNVQERLRVAFKAMDGGLPFLMLDCGCFIKGVDYERCGKHLSILQVEVCLVFA